MIYLLSEPKSKQRQRGLTRGLECDEGVGYLCCLSWTQDGSLSLVFQQCGIRVSIDRGFSYPSWINVSATFRSFTNTSHR